MPGFLHQGNEGNEEELCFIAIRIAEHRLRGVAGVAERCVQPSLVL
jgi:hypothetical protein